MQATNSLFAPATSLHEVATATCKQPGPWRMAVTLPTFEFETTLAEAGHSLPAPYSPTFRFNVSICAHVAHMDHPRGIDDNISHPLLSASPTVNTLGLTACLGVTARPVHDRRYMVVLCAVHSRPRDSNNGDLDLMSTGAEHIRRITSEVPQVLNPCGLASDHRQRPGCTW